MHVRSGLVVRHQPTFAKLVSRCLTQIGTREPGEREREETEDERDGHGTRNARLTKAVENESARRHPSC